LPAARDDDSLITFQHINAVLNIDAGVYDGSLVLGIYISLVYFFNAVALPDFKKKTFPIVIYQVMCYDYSQ